MIKLLLWLNYGEIMKVGQGRNFGVPQEFILHIWVFCGLPAGCCFFQGMALLIMMLSLNCYRSHWMVKKVFLNVQNIMTDNFNLVKSLRNTCKWVFSFKKWMFTKVFFQNIIHYISKILPSSNNTYFKGYLSQFLCKSGCILHNCPTLSFQN